MPEPVPTTVLRGGAAGTIGTAAMSALMLTAQRAGLFRHQPPERLTEAALAEAGAQPVSEGTENAASTVAHFAFGAGCGALFALAQRGLGGRVSPALSAPLFGLGVWAVNYKGVIPALGLMPPPEDDRPGRAATMVAGHVVWGATTGWALTRLPGGEDGPRR